MNRAVKTVGALIGAAALVLAVIVLRDATISRHTVQEPDSRLAVVFEADVKRSEPGQDVQDYAWAKVQSCRTEVALADPVGGLTPVESIDDTAYRLVLRPSLDDTDQRQFRGCMEDWNLDHVQIDVRSMEELPPVG